MFQSLTKHLPVLTMVALVCFAMVSCEKDPPEPNAVIASFQYEISADNWAEVTFTNYSQNATSYVWDFGDSNTSTDENVTHTFAEGGEYEVTLTATGEAGSATRTETVIVTDPNTAGQFLAGAEGKVWHLDREGVALSIGPGIGDDSWWSLGGVTPSGERPCVLDDSFTFNPDGSVIMNTGGTIFVDSDNNGGWLGQPEGCHDESEDGLFTGPGGEDLSAFANGGDYTYDYNTSAGTITVNGFGAYIGLPQKTNNGDQYVPVSEKVYTIFYTETGDVFDRMNVAMAAADGSSAWNFYLVSYHNPDDLPPIPAVVPTAAFTYVKEGDVVEFTNASSNATSYLWEFGDGATSTDLNAVHIYSGDGDYTVTLTAYDDAMMSGTTSQVISISSAVFTAADLSSPEGKTWRLDGESSYIVGPGQNSGAWWNGLDAAGVIERACQMDDEFTFFDDGTMVFNSQGQVWAEDYMAGAFACTDDAALTSPFDAFGSGTHSFTATDSEITVDGLGAYIGWNKAYNLGELPADGTGMPQSTITYEVFDYTSNDGVDRLTITVDYGAMPGESYWTMRMISD